VSQESAFRRFERFSRPFPSRFESSIGPKPGNGMFRDCFQLWKGGATRGRATGERCGWAPGTRKKRMSNVREQLRL
jgi:hypothetical protein